MKSLFYPRSVAILGVSDAPGNLGRTIAKNLDHFAFPGEDELEALAAGGAAVLNKNETVKEY